jgi:hypothetical protein
MTTVEKEIVRTDIHANSRKDLIEKFSDWVSKLSYDNSIILSIHGIISDVPREVPDEQG